MRADAHMHICTAAAAHCATNTSLAILGSWESPRPCPPPPDHASHGWSMASQCRHHVGCEAAPFSFALIQGQGHPLSLPEFNKVAFSLSALAIYETPSCMLSAGGILILYTLVVAAQSLTAQGFNCTRGPAVGRGSSRQRDNETTRQREAHANL
jgi:hypothetical protein